MKSSWTKKKDYLNRLRDNLEEKEKAYQSALNDFEDCLCTINIGIIHGRKEQASINQIKPFIANLTRASYERELAQWKLTKFRKEGVIYE